MAGLALAYGDEALSAFDLAFRRGDELHRARLGGCWDVRFEDVEPVREFNWAKGGQSFAGLYYSVTARGHVGYESWLERDRLILLDRDPQVVAIASQPFWLHWHDGRRERRHAPDYFVRLADGRARVVDVRAADRLDERTVQAFAATGRACAAADWEFERVGTPDPVFMENVRWLSRYRRERARRPAEVAARLVEAFARPRPLWAGAESVGDRLLVLPVLFHLLWSGALAADLESEPLDAESLVWTGRRQR
ncbi:MULTISPECIES: TnsA-like heteromeric transposase endonuclease subunit [Kitasatospora]|uniref:TnsA-like heteromeric transposase endonuclease subunit n=1 Tax=Kitasatospora TaxID=2063 RepID=UPI0015D5A1FF|nr:TnsA-like heteromeric transposase endonuclease subunit [Kitasatospora sp. GP30]